MTFDISTLTPEERASLLAQLTAPAVEPSAPPPDAAVAEAQPLQSATSDLAALNDNPKLVSGLDQQHAAALYEEAVTTGYPLAGTLLRELFIAAREQ